MRYILFRYDLCRFWKERFALFLYSNYKLQVFQINDYLDLMAC